MPAARPGKARGCWCHTRSLLPQDGATAHHSPPAAPRSRHPRPRKTGLDCLEQTQQPAPSLSQAIFILLPMTD